ncbi:MAG: hypothetical protein QM820_17245 [Minicystis sp.]
MTRAFGCSPPSAGGSRRGRIRITSESWKRRSRRRPRSLGEDDARYLLWTSLFQLCARDPEQMADQAFFYTMLRMVRYGGPFVDMVRARQRAWHEARLIFWLQHGARLEDMAAVYATTPTVRVPEEASLQHGIRPSGG